MRDKIHDRRGLIIRCVSFKFKDGAIGLDLLTLDSSLLYWQFQEASHPDQV